MKYLSISPYLRLLIFLITSSLIIILGIRTAFLAFPSLAEPLYELAAIQSFRNVTVVFTSPPAIRTLSLKFSMLKVE